MNRCYLYKDAMESTLFHCTKASVLGHLVLSFGITWVLPSTIHEALLGWKGSFIRENMRKLGKLKHFVFFGLFRKRETRELLTNMELMDRTLKYVILCTLHFLT